MELENRSDQNLLRAPTGAVTNRWNHDECHRKRPKSTFRPISRIISQMLFGEGTGGYPAREGGAIAHP
jgi:hypothetical protein